MLALAEGGAGVSSPRHEEMAAVRGNEEERGDGVGGGERTDVGVALTRYRGRDPFVGRLAVCFVSLC